MNNKILKILKRTLLSFFIFFATGIAFYALILLTYYLNNKFFDTGYDPDSYRFICNNICYYSMISTGIFVPITFILWLTGLFVFKKANFLKITIFASVNFYICLVAFMPGIGGLAYHYPNEQEFDVKNIKNTFYHAKGGAHYTGPDTPNIYIVWKCTILDLFCDEFRNHYRKFSSMHIESNAETNQVIVFADTQAVYAEFIPAEWLQAWYISRKIKNTKHVEFLFENETDLLEYWFCHLEQRNCQLLDFYKKNTMTTNSCKFEFCSLYNTKEGINLADWAAGISQFDR